MKNQGNMSSPKDNNNPPVTEIKGAEFCNLANKEIKSYFEETQQATEKHKDNSTKSAKKYMNEKFNKGIEIIKKNQTNSRAEEFNK